MRGWIKLRAQRQDGTVGEGFVKVSTISQVLVNCRYRVNPPSFEQDEYGQWSQAQYSIAVSHPTLIRPGPPVLEVYCLETPEEVMKLIEKAQQEEEGF